jgi:hypothetical protein
VVGPFLRFKAWSVCKLNIAKLVIGFIMSVLAGILGNAIWDRIKTGGISIPHFATAQLVLFVGVALIGFFFGWMSRAAPRKASAVTNGTAVDGKKCASLMRRGRELYERLAGLQTSQELPSIQIDMREWVNQTVAFLEQSNCDTEAVVFPETPKPSSEQMAAVANFPEWKRYDLAQLSIYRHRLEHIKEDKQIS